MADGAHMGIGAEEAMMAVIGGAKPTTTRNPAEMREYLLSHTEPDGYGGTAAYCAKLILEEFLVDPSLARLPADNVWDHDAPKIDGRTAIIKVGLYDTLKQRGVPVDQLDLTGFMWGWAVNAARYCVELEPLPNPAIVTIGEF